MPGARRSESGSCNARVPTPTDFASATVKAISTKETITV
jgi:hypothetical protein